MALGGRYYMGMGRESHFTAESKAIKALVELLIVHGYVQGAMGTLGQYDAGERKKETKQLYLSKDKFLTTTATL